MTASRLAIVVEDSPGDHELIKVGLEARGFLVLSALDSTQALDCLAGCPFPDLVVLDWFCEGPMAGDGPAQALIKDILRLAVAPIAIISSEPERAKENLPPEMPLGFCTFHGKLDIDDAIRLVNEWAGKREFAFARNLARSSASGMGRVTWRLSKHGEVGINGWLAMVETPHDFFEMFLRFTKREVESEEALVSKVATEIDVARSGSQAVTDLLLRVLSADRYYRPSQSEQPMCGDVFRNGAGQYAVLVNPACDMVQTLTRPRRAISAHLLSATSVQAFIAGHPGYSQENPDRRARRAANLLINQDPGGTGLVREFGLPLVPLGSPDPYSELTDLVIHLDAPIVVSWEQFQSRFPTEGRVARLDSPFLEALLRQYSLFADRIGLRDIPKDVLEMRGRLVSSSPSEQARHPP